MMPRQLVVILGMHRSGTSLITRSIELLGYTLGDNLMPAGVDNPKGFWEDIDIVQFNDKLLAHNQMSWDSLLDSSSGIYSKDLQQEALTLLESRFSNTDRFIIKDPRMSLLLDFWSRCFVEADISVHYLTVYRQPLDIAASLHARNGIEVEHGLLLAYRYNRALMTFLGDSVFVVGYRQFLENPLRELSRIAGRIGSVLDNEAAGSFIKGFVDPGLSHHEFTDEDLVGHKLAFPELVDLSAMMSRMAEGSMERFDSHRTQYPDPRSSIALSLYEFQLRADFSTKAVLHANIQEYDQENKFLQGARKQLEAELKDVDGRLREREDHVDLLVAEVSQFDQENKSLQGARKLLEAELKDVEGRLREREDHVDLLVVEVSQFDQENKSLQGARKQLEVELKDVEGRLCEREDHVDLLVAEVSQFDQENKSLQGARKQLEAELKDVEGRLREREEEREIERESERKSQEDLKQQIVGYQQQIVGYQQHLEDFSRIHQDVLDSVSLRIGRAFTYPVRKPVTTWLLPRLKGNNGGRAVVKFLRTCVAKPITALRMISLRRIKNFFLLLTGKQYLAEQVVRNYQLEMEKEVPVPDVEVHHHSGQELSEIKLSFPRCENPLVSVLIPVYNQIDYTLKCLASIKQSLPTVTIEIVVADDCSTDATPEVLAQVNGITVVRHQENLGFLRSCNRAVDSCRGDFIFLLNNDTTVHDGWLDKLVETFSAHPDAGLVGSKLVYPDGTLQEAGGIVWKDASGWNYGRNGDPDAPEFNYFREVDYVSGAAILFPRKLFLTLGKFDENLAPAYYEDTDFAFSVRKNGKKVYFQPASVITHFEGKSHGTDERSGIKQNQVINQGKFREKWAQILDDQHFENAEHVLQARERSRGKTTVLVIDHYVPHFDKDAGSRSTFLYLQLLVQSGFNVKFLGDNFFKHEPYTSLLQDMGIEVLYGNYYQSNWEKWLRDHAGYVDVVYMMRPHIAGPYIDVVNELKPRPRTIYFGHDLHYLRLQRQFELHPDDKLAAEKVHWERKEYALFEKFDQIYYPSQIEVDEILARKPNLPVKAIPLYAFDQLEDEPPEFSSRDGLIFVGGFNHPPNGDGLVWFVNEVFPAVLESLPDLQLHIVGSNMPDKIRRLESRNIQVEGFLSDEALGELYRRIRMSVVPLRFGAGIKGKVLDAMQKGIPVATTSIGAEGIPDAGTNLLVEDVSADLANCIVESYDDLEMLERHSIAGLDTIAKHFSTDAVLKVIEEDFRMPKPEHD
jgi:GT2 family glycosyltransferase